MGDFHFEFFHVYLVTFFMGVFWAVVSALLTGIFGGDGVSHHAGIGAGHFDPSLQLEPGMVAISPLSPTIIATFMATFGGVGVICIKVFGMSNYGSIPVAVIGGIGVSAALFGMLAWMFQNAQGTVSIEAGRLVGTRADVITPIPAEGFGEIAYLACGMRQCAAARSVDNQPIDRHTEVEIVRVVGGTFVVKPVRAGVPRETGDNSAGS
jgi:membrane protein implicated in regulation of membrane protease activity